MTLQELQIENEKLARRLQEAEETLAAIRAGTVDAFVVQEDGTPRVFTLETADRPYRILVENMQQAAVNVDARGIISYCNGRLAEWLHLPQEKFMGAPLPAFAPTAERPALQELLREGAGAMVQKECHFQRSDGTLVPTLLTMRPMPESRPSSICVLMTDLTSVKFEEERRQSEAKFRAIADSLPQIVWTARPDGSIDYYNQRWYEFTGFSPEEFVQSSWEAILHPDDVQRCTEIYFGCMRKGKPYQIEYRFKDRATGGYRWFMGRAVPVRDEEGEIVRWFGTCTDIDDQKRAEERLERTVAERTARLRETVGELEAFSYSIAHDLRAPLRSMQSYGHFLATEYGDKLDAQGLSYLSRLTGSAARMDRLIQDVLNYSQIVRSELPSETVEVEPLLRGIIESYPAFQGEGTSIVLEGPFPKVLGNEAALTQCFSNLLGNAVKFMAPQRKPSVRVWAKTGLRRARIYVQDNGIGIPPDQHERIFAIFQRASKDFEGTGIGLAIVKKAIERMGGRVGLESEPGKGSTFWIELKRAVPNEAAAVRNDQIYEPSSLR